MKTKTLSLLRNIAPTLALGAACVAYCVKDASVEAASVVATTSAVVLEPLTITGKTPLVFGVINSASSSGEITITPTNQRIVSGAINVSDSDPFERAKFNIKGLSNVAYNIQVPSQLTFVKEGAAAEPGVTALSVTNFKSYSANLNQETNRGKLDANGVDTVYVGGTLVVPSTVAAGRYSGEVPLTVTY